MTNLDTKALEADLPAEVWLAQERAAKDIMNLWAPDGPPALKTAIQAAMSRAWKSGALSAAVLSQRRE